MSFNEGSRLDTSQVTGGSSGSGGFGGFGGGGLKLPASGAGLVVVIVVGVVMTMMGVNPLGSGVSSVFDTQGMSGLESTGVDVDQCETGADANRDDSCRAIGTINSVQAYWSEALPRDVERQYREAQTVLYSGATSSPCGAASSQTGPFYCPGDERVYLDVSFFDQLTSSYGADGGNFAQMYVIAHEYGHHVQHVLGILSANNSRETGPTSPGVRIELMADCMAGVWAHHAANTTDDQGQRLLEPLTRADIDSALSAAAAVGDDHIQQTMGGGIHQESWTHGSSESRQRWFMQGYDSGTVNSCDTFATDAL